MLHLEIYWDHTLKYVKNMQYIIALVDIIRS